MSEPRTIIEEQAIGWIIRMRDPAFAGWEAFTLWLEENPVHAAIYDELALADADVPETLPAPPPPPPVPANDEKPARPRWAGRRGAIRSGATRRAARCPACRMRPPPSAS